MNAFDFYDCITSHYATYRVADKINNSEEHKAFLKKMYNSAKEKISIYSGELSTFLDVEFTKNLIDKLKTQNGNSIELNIIFGDIVANMEDEERKELYNPLLRGVEDENIIAKIYYNYFDLKDQIDGGYFHSIIIDEGKYIMIEAPHRYDDHKEEKNNPSIIQRQYFENCCALATDLENSYSKYIDFNGLELINSPKEFVDANRNIFEKFNELSSSTLKTLPKTPLKENFVTFF